MYVCEREASFNERKSEREREQTLCISTTLYLTLAARFLSAARQREVSAAFTVKNLETGGICIKSVLDFFMCVCVCV